MKVRTTVPILIEVDELPLRPSEANLIAKDIIDGKLCGELYEGTSHAYPWRVIWEHYSADCTQPDHHDGPCDGHVE